MKAKTCFFIGHREAAGDIMPALEKSVEKHISEYGVTAFVVGRYSGFDRLAASAVINAKRLHPEITLSLLLAYHPAERPVEKPEGFDATYYPPGMESVPRRCAIVRANRYMVDHADHMIAYAWHPASNARKLLTYALRGAGGAFAQAFCPQAGEALVPTPVLRRARCFPLFIFPLHRRVFPDLSPSLPQWRG